MSAWRGIEQGSVANEKVRGSAEAPATGYTVQIRRVSPLVKRGATGPLAQWLDTADRGASGSYCRVPLCWRLFVF
jgi:hypothetical protein